MSQRIDRRQFLLGASGAALALPMLEFFAPRKAFAQVASSPKRLVVVLHSHGRTVGSGRTSNGAVQDNWSPAPVSGPLPQTLSPLLAGLAPIRNEIVTVDGVDNLMRHATLHGDGHYSAERTCLTCRRPKADGSGGGPSIDYVAGQRLRASSTQRASVVMAGDSAAYDFHFFGNHFYGADGTPPTRLRLDPATALNDLFGPVSTDTPTLRRRLEARRGRVLDGVSQNFSALRARVSAADRERLDAHAEFIHALQNQAPAPTRTCARPVAPAMDLEANGGGGRLNGTFTPFQVQMLVQSLACDVLRVAALHFHQSYDPVFTTEFSGTSPYESRNYHDAVHNAPQLASATAPNLTTAYGFYTRTFTQLVQGLAAVREPDGSRLLDNTLVLWVSDMGYGASHHDFNIPVVLAGMRSAFPKGQGRHVVMSNRPSLGDLYAHVLRMLGGTDTTFGETGTLQSLTGTSDLGQLNAWAGAGGWGQYIQGSTPLHKGPLDF
jgi:hypothetical protein